MKYILIITSILFFNTAFAEDGNSTSKNYDENPVVGNLLNKINPSSTQKANDIVNIKVQYNNTVTQKLLDKFKLIGSRIKSFGIFVFYSLLIINIIFHILKTVLSEEGLSFKNIAGNILYQMIIAIMFFALFIEGDYLISLVYSGFDSIYQTEITQGGMVVINKFSDLSNPTSFLVKIFDTTSKILSLAIQNINPWNVFLMAIFILLTIGYVILMFLSIIVIFLVYLEFWIVNALSIFFLMFFTHNNTKDVAIRFLWYSLSISAQLFVGLIIIITVLETMESMVITSIDFGTALSFLLLALISFFGVQTIPQKVASLIGNYSSSNPINSIGSGVAAGISNQVLKTGMKAVGQSGGFGVLFGKEAFKQTKESGSVAKGLKRATQVSGKAVVDALTQTATAKMTGAPNPSNILGKTVTNLQNMNADKNNKL